ncbi:hypothetical protein KIN20_025466 [Parelaphostrongylus tenuis]|uniref:Uncharacterized protein n=1 Tax=Parelaphostrongylus tenuis TaxID=148309 RepID=A0AAD5N9C3_PARTN|nr:hypothetical protein KIN20_025466 [Parelaphostrongylus tenuis]
MVDRYSAIVAASLKDGSTLVRYQILESLTSLVKEQFMRCEVSSYCSLLDFSRISSPNFLRISTMCQSTVKLMAVVSVGKRESVSF